MRQSENSWHLDKRVPIAMILTIAAQTLGAVWWAGAINQRMAAVERRQNLMEERTVSQAHESRIAVLEAQWRTVDARLDRIEVRLDVIMDAVGAAEPH